MTVSDTRPHAPTKPEKISQIQCDKQIGIEVWISN